MTHFFSSLYMPHLYYIGAKLGAVQKYKMKRCQFQSHLDMPGYGWKENSPPDSCLNPDLNFNL